MQGVLYKFLLLIKFEVNTVSYRPCFFHMGHKYKQKKGGSLTYGTDRENQVNKIFIIPQYVYGTDRENQVNKIFIIPQCSNKGGRFQFKQTF